MLNIWRSGGNAKFKDSHPSNPKVTTPGFLKRKPTNIKIPPYETAAKTAVARYWDRCNMPGPSSRNDANSGLGEYIKRYVAVVETMNKTPVKITPATYLPKTSTSRRTGVNK